MPVEVVLFDMDGVLVDVSGSYHRAILETAAHFIGRPVPESTIQTYKNRGGFNDDWKLTHAIVTDAGYDVTFEAVVDAFQQRYRGTDWGGFICEEPALIDAATFDALCAEGLRLGLVTGRPEAEALWTLERFGWAPCFEVVVPMERQDGRGKPDPYPLQLALDALGYASRPEAAAYVGDTTDDMTAARAAGMWAIGLVPPYLDAEAHAAVLRSRGAHLTLLATSDLPAALARLDGHP